MRYRRSTHVLYVYNSRPCQLSRECPFKKDGTSGMRHRPKMHLNTAGLDWAFKNTGTRCWANPSIAIRLTVRGCAGQRRDRCTDAELASWRICELAIRMSDSADWYIARAVGEWEERVDNTLALISRRWEKCFLRRKCFRINPFFFVHRPNTTWL